MAGRGPVVVSRDIAELSGLMFDEDASQYLASHYEKQHIYKGQTGGQIFQNIGKQAVNSTQANGGGDDVEIDRVQERNLHRFQYVLDQYQEQPTLVDKYINEFIKQLLQLVRKKTVGQELSTQAYYFKYFYLLTKLRGAKRTLKCLPHQVEDLYWALQNITPTDITQNTLSTSKDWEIPYCLLLCLSTTSLIPFNMERFDGEKKIPGRMLTVERMISIGKAYLLEKADIIQDAAALMLGRLFSRSDVQNLYLKQHLDFTVQMFQQFLIACKEGKPAVDTTAKTIGVLKVFCILIKSSERESLLKVDIDYGQLVELVDEVLNITSGVDMKVRLLCTKLVQRVALLHLPQKVVTWRYNRGKRTLEDLDDQKVPAKQQKFDERPATPEEDQDVPDIVQDVLDILLRAITDRDTIVRWSAAKGIGRVTQRLPSDLAEQILPALLQEAEDAEQSIYVACSYHGVCLCLAELSRRALIATSELKEVVDFVVDTALQYDERKSSTHSVGSFVRDSACYVCWAFARAYEPHILKPFVNKIAAGLLAIATMDREVNCRRAASAAFQENVGRQGTFPSGIDIVVQVDYREVALKKRSISELAPWVCETDSSYQKFFLDHVAAYKLTHFDTEIRDLCANAFAQIYTTEHEESYIPNFISLALNTSKMTDLTEQHGALAALAELSQLGKLNDSSYLSKIVDIPEIVSQMPRWKGLAGEMLRPTTFALCKGLTKTKAATEEKKHAWSGLALQTILGVKWFQEGRRVVKIRDIMSRHAVDLLAFLGDEFIDLEEIFKNWDVADEDIRAGLALALGIVKSFEGKNVTRQDAIQKLADRIRFKTVNDEQWTLSRRDAVNSLAKLSDGSETVIMAIVAASKDYTMSKQKGDIGNFVRRAAMEAVSATKIQDERILRAVLTQMGSKLVHVREHARIALANLGHTFVPHTSNEDDCLLVLANHYYKKYPVEVLEPLLVCAGDLTQSLSKSAHNALDRAVSTKGDHVKHVCTILDENNDYDRVIVPALKALEVVLTRGMLISSDLLDRLKKLAANKSKSVQRIIPATVCITAIMSNTEDKEMLKSCVGKMVLLLCHNFPRIRRHAATALTEALLLCEDALEEHFEKFDSCRLNEILEDTEWDAVGQAAVIKTAKTEIAAMFK